MKHHTKVMLLLLFSFNKPTLFLCSSALVSLARLHLTLSSSASLSSIWIAFLSVCVSHSFRSHTPSSNVSHSQAPSSRPSLSTNQQDSKLTITTATRYHLDPPPRKQTIKPLPFSLLLASLFDCGFFSSCSWASPAVICCGAVLTRVMCTVDVKTAAISFAFRKGHILGTWVGMALGGWPLLLHSFFFFTLQLKSCYSMWSLVLFVMRVVEKSRKSEIQKYFFLL